jgi:hypothetical protein
MGMESASTDDTNRKGVTAILPLLDTQIVGVIKLKTAKSLGITVPELRSRVTSSQFGRKGTAPAWRGLRPSS